MKRILMGLGICSLLLAGWAQAQTYGGSSGSSGSSQSGSSTGVSSQGGSSMGGATGTSPSSPSDQGTAGGTMGGSPGGTMGGSASTMGSPSTKEITGRVENFDRSNNTLTVAGSDKPFRVDSSTQVLKNGQTASLSDIKEGDQVRASYSGTGDNLHVQKLDIMSSGSMGAPSTAPSTQPSPSGSQPSPSGSKGY